MPTREYLHTSPASEAGETDLATFDKLRGTLTVECPGCGYGYTLNPTLPFHTTTGECPACGVVVRITREG